MLTNFDIIDACEKYRIPLVGVFNKNRIPPDIICGGYVINMQNDIDEHGKLLDGTHWVAFYIDKNHGKPQACYFDSFGFAPPIDVQNFLSCFSPYPYNCRVIQNINSGICGYYCIYFLWFMSTHRKKEPNLDKRFDMFLNHFDHRPEKNLRILKKDLDKIKKPI
jgi:hypothetical protein